MVAKFPGHSRTFEPENPNLALTLERFKKDVRRCTEAQRRTAMCKDAGLANDASPLWLITSHTLVAQWVDWTDQQQALEQQYGNHSRSAAYPVHLSARIGDLEMSLTGQIYDHDLTCELVLSAHPLCRFNDRLTPQLIIEDNILPETPVAALIDQLYFGNQPALYKLFDHPLFLRCAVPMHAIDPGQSNTLAVLADHRRPIIAAPSAALARMPTNAPTARPWGITEQERDALSRIRL